MGTLCSMYVGLEVVLIIYLYSIYFGLKVIPVCEYFTAKVYTRWILLEAHIPESKVG